MKDTPKEPSAAEYRMIDHILPNKIKNRTDTTTPDKIIDHILYFDPDDASTALKTSSLQPEFLSTRNLPTIPWPDGGAPQPQPINPAPVQDAPLPQADVLIVTWTVAEALALSDVLTPGFRSKTAWYKYTHNWPDFKLKIKKGAPAFIEDRLGLWFPTKIGDKNVICYKSELHFARDGSKVPVKDLWLQLIDEVKPKLVITTGTAGGIGSEVQLGDVALTTEVKFDCAKTFKNSPFAQQQFKSKKSVPVSKVSMVNEKLMGITTSFLPTSTRTSKIISRRSAHFKNIDVVTTDFFAFDDSTDFYGLQKLGLAVEMGDAVLGLACSTLTKPPAWVAIRNASDPQVDGTLPYPDRVALAGRIYEKYGYWTTVNSAIACWAVAS